MSPLPDFDPDLLDLDSSLQIKWKRDGSSIVIALFGELDTRSCDQVDAAVRDAEETDIGRVRIDLSEVTFIDSTGLSLLLAARKRNEGRFDIVPSKHESVSRLLALTGTTEMLG